MIDPERSSFINPYAAAYDPLTDCQIETLPDIYLKHLGPKTDGYFVEVGAFDGFHWSNTQMLAALGWRGLLIEPHPVYYAQCRERYAVNENVNVFNCAVGCYNGPGLLYTGGSLSTLEKQTVEIYGKLPTLQSSGLNGQDYIECKVYTLDKLLDIWCGADRVDVLSLDVEGGELATLAGLNLARWKPRLAIVETHEMYPDIRLSWKAGAVDTFFLPLGYQKVHADTINTIYVLKDQYD